MDPERSIVDGFRRILRTLRISAQTTQSELGVSAAQLYVLRHLADKAGASISELAKETLTDRSSVADVVERLVERGLAERSPHPADRRRASVRITQPGADLVKESGPAPMDLLIEALKALPVRDRQALSRLITDLVAAMGLEGSPAGMLFEDQTVGVRTRKRTQVKK